MAIEFSRYRIVPCQAHVMLKLSGSRQGGD